MAEALYQRDLTKAAANKEGVHILFGLWIPSFFDVYFSPEATSLTESPGMFSSAAGAVQNSGMYIIFQICQAD